MTAGFAAPGTAVAAVDVGGTTVKALALDADGGMLAHVVIPTPRDGAELADALAAVVDGLAATAGEHGLSLGRVGIASPGLVDARAGVVRYAANLGWRDLPLGRIVAARTGARVVLDNDARAGARAESARAPEEEAGDLAFVPLGTGASAAYSVAGRIARGAAGAAGEFGHLLAVRDGEPCSCGARGCVEAYASATNVLARYRRLGGESPFSTPEVVARVARDPIARQVWEDALEALAVGLSSLVALLDPSRVVVGGGLSLAGDALLLPLRARLAERLPWRDAPRVVASELGAHSPLVGAALLGWEAPHAAAAALVARIADQLLAAPDAAASPVTEGSLRP